MERKKTLVVISLFILMATLITQFPVLPTMSGTAVAGEQLNLHAIDPMTQEGVLIDLYSPEETVWHELWPTFCGGPYALWSWKDNNMDGKLSPCDKVDLLKVTDPTNPLVWPFVGFFHVDQVTVTLLVSNITNTSGMAHPAFIEFEGDIQAFPWDDPVCTQWHEKWPVYSTEYHLSSWVDAGYAGVPDGILSPGDVVDLTFKVGGQPVGPTEWYVVAQVATDIVVTALPASDYITMGGKVDGKLWLYVNVNPNTRPGMQLPLAAPFARMPFLSPMQLLQEIYFGPPVDVNGDGTPDIIPIQKVQVNPIVHYVYVAFRGKFWQFILKAIAPGQGVIFINPAMPGDVDCYTRNLDSGVYWAPPSQLAGQFAAASGGHYKPLIGDFSPPMASRFPSTGLDPIPGTRLWGDVADGFGNGAPDPVGSSILMLPLVLLGNEWNGTDWVPTIFVPMPLVLTTGTAYDHVAEPASNLYCRNSTEVGTPWDAAFTKVTYVCAWSNLLYCLNPDDNGDCMPDPEAGTGWYYTVDFFYEYVEKKVRIDKVIADITCDQKVDIIDLVKVGVAFGCEDEGLGRDGIPGTADDKLVADPKFDPRADLDGNGFINIVDLVTVAIDFGKTLDP